MGSAPAIIQEHDKIKVARIIGMSAGAPVAGAAMAGKKLLPKPPAPPVHHSLGDFAHLIGKKLGDVAQATKK